MALIVKKPKGTEDIVPSKVYKWHTVEKIVSEAAEIYGFKEIRVPTFEETGLFVRSVGETTDVVQKEMYSVSAAGDSKFTLRPEGTSGTMRAVLENGIMNEGLPQKVYYILSFSDTRIHRKADSESSTSLAVKWSALKAQEQTQR